MSAERARDAAEGLPAGAPDHAAGAPDHAAIAREQGAARASTEREAIARLIDLVGIVYRLRDPDGCPWDRAQSVESMAKNLIEESCEAGQAIAGGHDADIAEELGDTLMNVVLMARIAEQGGRFGLAQVAQGIAEKLVRRHPHVFGGSEAADEAAALASWNRAKAAEAGRGPHVEPRAIAPGAAAPGEAALAAGPAAGSGAAAPREAGDALAGVPDGLPGLLVALRVGEKAASVGFDWPDAAGALRKLEQELAELRDALDSGLPEAVEDELGDVLFSAVNVARKAGLDPELALRRTIEKFRRRFAAVQAAVGERLGEAPLEELERHWLAASHAEHAARAGHRAREGREGREGGEGGEGGAVGEGGARRD